MNVIIRDRMRPHMVVVNGIAAFLLLSALFKLAPNYLPLTSPHGLSAGIGLGVFIAVAFWTVFFAALVLDGVVDLAKRI